MAGKELIAQKLLLRGKIKKILPRAHVCSLEQRAWNAHDQDEQTLSQNIEHYQEISYYDSFNLPQFKIAPLSLTS